MTFLVLLGNQPLLPSLPSPLTYSPSRNPPTTILHYKRHFLLLLAISIVCTSFSSDRLLPLQPCQSFTSNDQSRSRTRILSFHLVLFLYRHANTQVFRLGFIYLTGSLTQKLPTTHSLFLRPCFCISWLENLFHFCLCI